MSTVHVACPKCQNILKVSAAHLGKSGTCNRCGNPIVVPELSRIEPDASAFLKRLEEAISSLDALNDFADTACSALLSLPECGELGKAIFFLTDEKAGGLRLAWSKGQFSPEFLADEAFVPFGKCLCGTAAVTGQVAVCENCFQDPRHEHRWMGMQTHGHYVIPLKHTGKVFGVLTLYTENGTRAGAEKILFLENISARVGQSLARLIEAP